MVQKTWMATEEDIKAEDRDWYLVDASGVPLGRMASRIATILQGKHKPTYTPHVDTGDYVVVLNAGSVELTGNKKEDKFHYRHSGYLGNMKKTSYGEMLEENPSIIIEDAVRRMLPQNKLAEEMAKKLRVYDSEDHPHSGVDFEKMEL